MGILKKVGGKVAKGIAQSGALGGAIDVAADAFGATSAGQSTAGRIIRNVAQNPEHREGIVGAAINLATPGIRNKGRAALTLGGIANDIRRDHRGGAGAVSGTQFQGHLPPPPLGGLPNPPAGAGGLPNPPASTGGMVGGPAPWEPGGSFSTAPR
jgi:hypothetical protein